MRFRFQVLKQDSGSSRIRGLGFGIEGLWLRIQGLGFGVQGLRFRIQGLGFREFRGFCILCFVVYICI